MAFNFYYVSPKYCDYLRKFDNKVPYNNLDKKGRPFLGIVFTVGHFNYFAPLSSPKAKHRKMKNKIDFLKIENGKYGAINFNNMIPVNENDLTLLEYQNIKNKKRKYLFIAEYRWCSTNEKRILNKARNLYFSVMNKDLKEHILNRCCDFELLEQKCQEWQQIQQEEYKKGLKLYYKHHPNEYSDELEDDFDDQDYDDEPSMKM